MSDVVLPTRKPSKLPLGERIAAGAYGARAQWPAGFQLYQRGAPADGVFIVLHGHVTLRSPVAGPGKGGRGFVTAIVTAGETFGAEGISAVPTYVTDARATDDVETLHLGTTQFRAFVREQPSHALALVGQIMAERSALMERLHELATLNVEDRLAAILLRLSADQSFVRDDGLLLLESHQHRLLCELVGATRESITLALSRLVSAGIANRRGTSFLIDANQLSDRIRMLQFEMQAPMDVVIRADL